MMISKSQIDSTLKIRSGSVQSEDSAKKTKSQVKPAGCDQFSISPQASEVAKIKKAIDAMPDERAEKVEALSRAVAEGTYKVDAADIAEMMMRRSIADRLG